MRSTHAPPTIGRVTRVGRARASAPRGAFGIPIGITAKLVTMVTVPLVALVILLTLNISERLSGQRDLQSLVAASALISDAEEVNDGLQLERGNSSLYLASGGLMYREELIAQWEETDAAIAILKDTLAHAGENRVGGFLASGSSDLMEGLEQVGSLRQGVLNLEVTWSESLSFYSQLIEQLHASPDGLVLLSRLDPRLSGIYMGILHLSDAAEAAGIERALVSKILIEGIIKRDDVELLGRLAGRQEDSLESYRAHVPPDIRSTYEAQLSAVDMGPVEDVRRQIADGDLSLEPGVWFGIASAPVAAISSIEDNLLVGLADRSTELSNEARTSMWRFVIFGVLMLTISLLAAALVGRRLSKRTIRLARVAEAIQDGDFSQRADADSGDELGTLGIAFNQITEDFTALNQTLEVQVEARTTELRASEAQNRAMLEAIPDLIFRLSSDGVYLDFIFVDSNAAGTPRIFPPPERFVGKHIGEVLPPELAGKFLSASRRARRSGEVQQLEYQFPMDEELREREARIVAIPGSEETMVVVRDITERKAAEHRLQELIRTKNQFIASVSHELRTPLTTVVGFAELLRDAESNLSPAEQEEMISSITEQASDISNIVEDLLVAARTEIDTLHVTRVPVNLRSQLAQVLEASREASADQIEIGGGPVTALGDPGRVRQILRNLLTNAVRYGGDHIQVRMHSNGSRAFVQVWDDGQGVPDHDHETIFEPYQRSHATPGRPGSVGLGLTISRALARHMGGDLTYRYQDGNSIFEVTLAVPDQSSSKEQPRFEDAPSHRNDEDGQYRRAKSHERGNADVVM